MSEVEISIIIPVYNSEKYLKRLYLSIQKQTFQNFEIIFVNDGSTDKSEEIIKIWQTQDSSIKLINQINQGAPKARNRGIEASVGKYLYFCDADDELENNTLELLYNTAIKEKSDLVIGNYIKVNINRGNTLFIKINEEACKKNYRSILLESPLPGNKLFKKDFIDKNNIKFQNVKIGQDLLFYLIVLSYTNRISIISDFIYKYYINEGSISNSNDTRILDILSTLNIIKKHYQEQDIYDIYKDELQYLNNCHIMSQLFKIPFIDNKIMRKEMCSLLVDGLEKKKLKENTYYINKKSIRKIYENLNLLKFLFERYPFCNILKMIILMYKTK